MMRTLSESGEIGSLSTTPSISRNTSFLRNSPDFLRPESASLTSGAGVLPNLKRKLSFKQDDESLVTPILRKMSLIPSTSEIPIPYPSKAEQPNQDIHLSAGNAAKPFQLMKHLLLTLKSHWWCHTALPTQTNNQWPFCSYLSISDQEVTDKNPFRPWDKTIHSKSISYNCRLKKPHKKLSFFYYK